MSQSDYHDIDGVSCDQHGASFKEPTKTVTAYLCTVHGGGRHEGENFRVFWDGSKIVPENKLTEAEINALMFD